MNWIYVFIGGGVGALSRFGIGHLLANKNFPISTLIVNALGCFIIGLSSNFMINNERFNLLFVIGFLGGFTTFSTYALDLLKMQSEGQMTKLVVYLALSNLLGLIFVLLGNRITQS